MKFDVTGIGNAVVDVITHTSNKFIKENIFDHINLSPSTKAHHLK